jgi:ABC-type glucose/galactose transport system permease subunit
VLCILRSGLTWIGVLPYIQDLITGGVLITVALLDAPGVNQAAYELRRLIALRR